MNIDAKKIGRRLAQLREENGFTQDDIQKLTGINRTTYSKNESGKAIPSLSNLQKFAKIYGVSLDFICDIESNRSKMVLFDSGRSMTKEEKMLVSYFRLLTEEQRKDLLLQLEKDAGDCFKIKKEEHTDESFH